jgi:hypothetical protein
MVQVLHASDLGAQKSVLTLRRPLRILLAIAVLTSLAQS